VIGQKHPRRQQESMLLAAFPYHPRENPKLVFAQVGPIRKYLATQKEKPIGQNQPPQP
jgi:hypothetical protein